MGAMTVQGSRLRQGICIIGGFLVGAVIQWQLDMPLWKVLVFLSLPYAALVTWSIYGPPLRRRHEV